MCVPLLTFNINETLTNMYNLLIVHKFKFQRIIIVANTLLLVQSNETSIQLRSTSVSCNQVGAWNGTTVKHSIIRRRTTYTISVIKGIKNSSPLLPDCVSTFEFSKGRHAMCNIWCVRREVMWHKYGMPAARKIKKRMGFVVVSWFIIYKIRFIIICSLRWNFIENLCICSHRYVFELQKIDEWMILIVLI